MLTTVKEEGSLSGCCVFSVVITELGHSNPTIPVVLLVINEDAKVLFYALIHSFGLSISDWMIGGRRVLSNPNKSEEFANIFGSEPGVAVVDNFSRKTVISENAVKDDIGEAFGREFDLCWFEFYHFGKSVNDY